jgi:hypothetical protein
MGAGTTTCPSSSTSLLLNIQSPSRRKQVRHEAELGTCPIRGFVRPCHPINANASAARFGGLSVATAPDLSTTGGGCVKKSMGSCERILSMSTLSGRRRLNSYGRKGALVHSSSYRCRSAANVTAALENERRSSVSVILWLDHAIALHPPERR